MKLFTVSNNCLLLIKLFTLLSFYLPLMEKFTVNNYYLLLINPKNNTENHCPVSICFRYICA